MLSCLEEIGRQTIQANIEFWNIIGKYAKTNNLSFRTNHWSRISFRNLMCWWILKCSMLFWNESYFLLCHPSASISSFFTLKKDVENIHTSEDTYLKLIRNFYRNRNFHSETLRVVWNDYTEVLLSSFMSKQQASLTTSVKYWSSFVL